METLETLEAAVARNVSELRHLRRLSVRGLSERLKELGLQLLPSGVTKIEKQERRVSVAELVALAVALEVSPVRLLLPAGRTNNDMLVTPNMSAPWAAVWRWAVGDQPLVQRDEEVPWDDPRVREFIRECRPYEHRPIQEAYEFLGKRVSGRFEATITHEKGNLRRSLGWEEFEEEVVRRGER